MSLWLCVIQLISKSQQVWSEHLSHSVACFHFVSWFAGDTCISVWSCCMIQTGLPSLNWRYLFLSQCTFGTLFQDWKCYQDCLCQYRLFCLTESWEQDHHHPTPFNLSWRSLFFVLLLQKTLRSCFDTRPIDGGCPENTSLSLSLCFEQLFAEILF